MLECGSALRVGLPVSLDEISEISSTDCELGGEVASCGFSSEFHVSQRALLA